MAYLFKARLNKEQQKYLNTVRQLLDYNGHPSDDDSIIKYALNDFGVRLAKEYTVAKRDAIARREKTDQGNSEQLANPVSVSDGDPRSASDSDEISTGGDAGEAMEGET